MRIYDSIFKVAVFGRDVTVLVNIGLCYQIHTLEIVCCRLFVLPLLCICIRRGYFGRCVSKCWSD